MINISRQTIWFVVILITLVSIYCIFFNDSIYNSKYNNYKYMNSRNLSRHNHDNTNPQYLNIDESFVPNRKKINKKHSKSKRIHVSPNIQYQEQLDSIKSMNKILKNRINKTKLDVIDETTSEPVDETDADSKTKTKQTIKSKPKFLIKLFFADWCPHCTHYKPIWNRMKSKYAGQIIFEDIDCTSSNPGLDYVQGLPTISLYDLSNRHIENYENNGDPSNLDRFIQNLLETK